MREFLPRRVVALLAGIVLLITLFACGGGGGGLTPLPTFTPGSVTDTERIAAMDEVQNYLGTITDDSGAGPQVVAKMKTMPIFLLVETSASGDVVGWFKDGRQYIVMISDDTPPATSTATPQTKPQATTAKPLSLTHGKKAYLINAMEAARPDVCSTIKPALQNQGYEVSLMAGTVEDYKLIQDAGLLFVHAHGIQSTDKNRVQHFYYSTSELANAQTLGAHTAEWDDDSLATANLKVWDGHGGFTRQRKFVISEKFLTNHGLSFAPNAFWMSQSCSSLNPAIQKVALGGGSTGVATYAGWDKPELSGESTATTSFVFDRLLGQNAVAPTEEETPPPYDFNKLRSALTSTTRPGSGLPYGTSNSNKPAHFSIVSAGGSTVHTIIPSITSTTVNVDDDSLTIKGFFGQSQGLVTLNGTTLTPISWSETSVKVHKPSADQGVLVLRSLGADSPAGYLLSQPYQYKGLGITITPNGVALDFNEFQTFTASITNGTMPQGATFKWTLTGLGKINGTTVVTSSSPSVSYKAPSQTSVDSLKVQLIVNGIAVAEKTTSIVAGFDSTIDFTISGTWDQSKTPPNGHYTYSDGQGARFFPDPDTDALTCSYDIGATDQTIGVLVTAVYTPGQPIVAGQTFTHHVSGVFGPGQYQLTMATNQGNPDAEGSQQWAIGTLGSMTIDSVTTLNDGHQFIHYTFTASNGNGGTVTGSGTCKIIVFP